MSSECKLNDYWKYHLKFAYVLQDFVKSSLYCIDYKKFKKLRYLYIIFAPYNLIWTQKIKIGKS